MAGTLCSIIYHLTKLMKHNLTIILSLLIFTSGYTQRAMIPDSTKSIEWINSLAYLPSVYGEHEYYYLNNNRFKHKYSKTRVIWRLRWNSKKIFKSHNKQSVIKSFNTFLTYNNQKVISIGLLKADKDSLVSMSKKEDFHGNPLYSCKYSNLVKYISNSDTIQIDIEVFNSQFSKTMDAMTSVIDGAPFWINLNIINMSSDTIRFEYNGNLYDGVKDTNVDEFLTYYKIYNSNKLFRYTPIDSYFTKENLYKVILRYIDYKENPIDMDEFYNIKSE